MLERLGYDDFAPLVGQEFSLSEQATPLRLASATPGRRPAAASERASFSLLFQGPASTPLGQGMYRMSHERLGALDLFIVPVGERDGTRDYEAIFN